MDGCGTPGGGKPSRATVLVVLALVLALLAGSPAIAQDGGGDPDPTSTTTTSTTTAPTSTTTASSVPSTLPPDDTGADEEAPPPVAPPSRLPIDPNAIANLRDQYDEAVAAEADLLAAFELSGARLAELNAQLVGLDGRLLEIQDELLAAEEVLQEAESRLHITEIRLSAAEAELGEARRRLEVQTVEAYISGGRSQVLSQALLSAESVDDLSLGRVYAEAVLSDQDRVIAEFIELRDEAQELRDQAETIERERQVARDEVATREQALRSERDGYAQAQTEAFLLAAGQQELVAQLEGRRTEYELRLSVLSGSSDGIAQILAARQAGQVLPAVTLGIFLRPVPGPQTSDFGPRIHPIFGTTRQHNGIDLDGNSGDPIMASEAGIVVIAEPRGGYGNTVVIDHGNGLATLYAHQSSLGVRVGDVVTRGQVIGRMGSTGYSTGPHLHWEVRVFGVPVDPKPYLA